ncbi:MAG: SelT/SelW/SelH family protein [Bacteroidota bacterium]|nr:SelT/SelW/SelH family protein [Bacteroidota bacterium]
MKPKITIEYCTKCGWLLRAAWMAQELLTTFTDDLQEVAIKPGEVGGIFEIRLNEEVIFSRKEEGHFPDAKELKQLVRNYIDPERDLGHIDKK